MSIMDCFALLAMTKQVATKMQYTKTIKSCTWKPIVATQVRFVSGESPRVTAAIESSSPIFVMETSNGTKRYSRIENGFLSVRRLNKRIPRIRIACPIARASSNTVGKKRIITVRGIVNLFGTCIRAIAAKNSFTLVVCMT